MAPIPTSLQVYDGIEVVDGKIYCIGGHDGSNALGISAGFERALSSNIVLTTQADVYSQTTLKVKGGSEVKLTSLLSNGRVGVAYLF